MPIKEVCSPISTRGKGGPGSNPPRTFPSRTTPGRADQQEPSKASVSLGEGGGELHVTGPKELPEKRPQERQSPEE